MNSYIDSTGYTYAHEHLHIDLSNEKNNIDCRLDQYSLLVAELIRLYHLGVRNIVEVTNRYMGRNPQFLLDIMRDSKINVVASTGYYQQKFYPEIIKALSVKQIAQEMVDEIKIGIDGTKLKAGVIAEIGSSFEKITDDERKVFHAAAIASLETGRPISTHTTLSTMGYEQFVMLTKFGVPPERIVIGHCDLKDNLNTILPILEGGGWVQFDTIGKNDYYPDEKRIEMLQVVKSKGFLGKVMLSMDITRRSHLKQNGGLGFDYLITTFVPMLLNAGFTQQCIDLMLRENPIQFFNYNHK